MFIGWLLFVGCKDQCFLSYFDVYVHFARRDKQNAAGPVARLNLGQKMASGPPIGLCFTCEPLLYRFGDSLLFFSGGLIIKREDSVRCTEYSVIFQLT